MRPQRSPGRAFAASWAKAGSAKPLAGRLAMVKLATEPSTSVPDGLMAVPQPSSVTLTPEQMWVDRPLPVLLDPDALFVLPAL